MTHPQPHLTAPILLHPADLKSNAELTRQITNFTNEAFTRSRKYDPAKWQNDPPRFSTPESYHEMLVGDSVVALVFDKMNEQEEGKLVACAAAVPWKGGWAKEDAGIEDGWEIKAVAVHGDSEYLHKGLAVRVMGKLEEYLVDKEKAKAKVGGRKKGCLTLWILAAACINGVYWRKRGYREVRRSTEGEGTWGCLTSFDLVVLRKDVEFQV
jgi:hypothetical protein